jgi:DNA (cytosine-5)-methyltransferase 1
MKMLDLGCGGGLGAWGYWLSGRFHTIVGVDINPEMRTKYSFDFECRDFRTLDYDYLAQFDFIHASPPCQAYSKITPDKSKHMRLIAATHLMLFASGKPYVIENVEGSGIELRPNVVANGFYFGLPSDRRRYFHATGLEARRLLKISSGLVVNVHGGGATRADVIQALGLDVIPEKQRRYLRTHDMEQGVPPAMTRYLAETMFPTYKAMIG